MEYVVFCGNDRIGKSSMSRSLQTLLHSGCKKRTMIFSFSDALRRELVDLYGIPESLIYDKTINKATITLYLRDYDYDELIPHTWVRCGLIRNVKAFKDVEITLRELFITHGTRIRRLEDPYYWSKRLEENIKANEGSFDLAVIDDPRDEEDFIFFENKTTYLYHLVEHDGDQQYSNSAQDKMNKWLEDNPDKITDRIRVPRPLLQFTADNLNKKHVIPKVLPRVRKKKIW